MPILMEIQRLDDRNGLYECFACARCEKGHEAVSGGAILHRSRVKRVTKLFGISFWHVSAVKRVTQLVKKGGLSANP